MFSLHQNQQHPLVTFTDLPSHHPLSPNHSFHSSFWNESSDSPNKRIKLDPPAEVILPPPSVLKNPLQEILHAMKAHPQIQKSEELMKVINSWGKNPNEQISQFMNLFVHMGNGSKLEPSPVVPPLSNQITMMMEDKIASHEPFVNWKKETIEKIDIFFLSARQIYGHFDSKFSLPYLSSLITYLTSLSHTFTFTDLTVSGWKSQHISAAAEIRFREKLSLMAVKVGDSLSWLGYTGENVKDWGIDLPLEHFSETGMRRELGLYLLDLVSKNQLSGSESLLKHTDTFFRALLLLHFAFSLIIKSTTEEQLAKQRKFLNLGKEDAFPSILFFPLDHDFVVECRAQPAATSSDRIKNLFTYQAFDMICHLAHGLMWSSLAQILDLEA